MGHQPFNESRHACLPRAFRGIGFPEMTLRSSSFWRTEKNALLAAAEGEVLDVGLSQPEVAGQKVFGGERGQSTFVLDEPLHGGSQFLVIEVV